MANNKLSRFDAAEYLDTPEARVEYLCAALETEDKAFILDAIGVVARAEGMTEVAERAGVGRASLYKTLRADSNPEFETVMRVMHALGVRLSAVPVSRELEPPPLRESVGEAVLRHGLS